MIQEKRIDEEHYVCNYCGHDFNVRNAIPAKGNIFFCSMECILKYDDEMERRNR